MPVTFVSRFPPWLLFREAGRYSLLGPMHAFMACIPCLFWTLLSDFPCLRLSLCSAVVCACLLACMLQCVLACFSALKHARACWHDLVHAGMLQCMLACFNACLRHMYIIIRDNVIYVPYKVYPFGSAPSCALLFVTFNMHQYRGLFIVITHVFVTSHLNCR
jgi:hypothetical protein